jgi:hypothetical protein
MDHVRRPKATVLPDSALVPEGNLETPPAQFTHEVIAEAPFYYSAPKKGAAPDGTLGAGTKVSLCAQDGPMCQVVDARGLRVFTACSGLRTLA